MLPDMPASMLLTTRNMPAGKPVSENTALELRKRRIDVLRLLFVQRAVHHLKAQLDERIVRLGAR